MRAVFVYELTIKITITAEFSDSSLWCGGSDLYKEILKDFPPLNVGTTSKGQSSHIMP